MQGCVDLGTAVKVRAARDQGCLSLYVAVALAIDTTVRGPHTAGRRANHYAQFTPPARHDKTIVCRVIAKFHYTDPTGPARTRTDFFCGETPLGPCGSGRVRVVEFSF